MSTQTRRFLIACLWAYGLCSLGVAPAVARGAHASHDSDVVGIGHDATLAADRRADSVVAIIGSATSAGEVADAVVSILGSSRVTGPVGDSVVAVLGGTYIDSQVHGDVVAVLGDVELGPHAEIDGDVVTVGGTVVRDPAAVIHGGVQDLSFGPRWFDPSWLRAWFTRCLMYGRLLAFSPDLGWAWAFALITLALYALTTVLFRDSVERCTRALTEQPGASLAAGLLAQLATPLLIGLLAVTVVGLLAVPVVVLTVLIAESFGRLAVLAWIGAKVLKPAHAGALSHPAWSVCVGGLLLLLVYTVPLLGLLVYKVVGFVGLGAVVFAVLSEWRGSARAAAPQAAAGAPTTAAAAAAELSGAGAATAAAPAQAAAAPATQAGTAATHDVLAYPRAGFWIRMAALLIDVIVVSVVVEFLFNAKHLHLVVLAAYGAVMWKLRGATLGGIICHLHVVRLDGRPMDWPTAAVRALGCFLSLLVVGLGFLWIAFDPEHQAWHDKIAGTVVVRRPKGVPLV